MQYEEIHNKLQRLRSSFKGDIFVDNKMRILYATDSSAYREIPIAVTRPKDKDDIKLLIKFANRYKSSLIPRTAGTSLAGQVVGAGIIVDVSKYMTQIIEINEEEKWVRVEPGVVLDELNMLLKPKGLFFAPETSTSNRCMIGGMLGNNSCGAHSLVYGSTRDHTLSVKTLLSDGSEVVFGELTKSGFTDKLKLNTLEGDIYRNIESILSNENIRSEIENQYPDKSIKRRNTGYAIDLLADSNAFGESDNNFNFSKLLAGSEGTLAFTTEIKLNLVELPPVNNALICVHLNTVSDALRANIIALKHKPVSVELMDKAIMDLTKGNREQNRNRFFIKGDPGAVLIVEFAENDKALIYKKAEALQADMLEAGFGYHFPIVEGENIAKVWALRKAGLGVLSNMKGDAKPVPVTEDTAVKPELLPNYISEFNTILEKYNLSCVYYAHIATGELHLRPVLNLKDKKDRELFHTIAYESAKLVKKYKGSLSGEHGDGRLRGEFIPLMLGDKIYGILKELKKTWDPNNIFNPNKIVDTPVMNTHLRYGEEQINRKIKTVYDFSETNGILGAAEKCTGSGDCRKSHLIGGTMCPSYQATRDENHVTRARANVLREYLSHSTNPNPFDHQEIYETMELCLSCKACKSECPSSVDVAKLKAEFLQHFYDTNGIPVRTRLIAYLPRINRFLAFVPQITNFILSNKSTSKLFSKLIGFSGKRRIPMLYETTLKKWAKKNIDKSEYYKNGTVYLFNDEFTNFNDSELGIKAILLLNKLGYKVILPNHLESGRTYISKGLIRTAKKIAQQNILLLKSKISEYTPLVGIEPSAILSFRDEYIDFADQRLKEDAKQLAKNAMMIDEFIAREIDRGHIRKESFTKEKLKIKLHGHCHQKAIASTSSTLKLLSLPENYEVDEIPSGCCGMAGSFGYEKEHYELSQKIGELVLFPEIRKTDDDVIIVAPGTSCRHQIEDGTSRNALHPIEVLYNALID